ncbi:adenosylcobinamide kinase/adenosylcobinamide phosphate guanyltransferase [Thiomicrorhabdus immobilis]|uniref:Bifunctional adenosylcobalamin biosynthesis protein n=1 Tax=Thiomicrorhabdus immobilis TaxID=2791037 RepID=A0ABM7MCQ9_9GAMM|nr:bifunctional adenosylcobinamide kinase/adenosylcobinamide-phosphate guanylyltransferase [Thiomicrorhabdus immobilis]BCN93189.1 adenosylcobinamide kinase/adenosylcobinamide phosphate guanyltransferase [Thiomicrorhabdus immobilis]
MLHFILGGARSGKSRFAENLAKQFESQGKTVFYVATATTQYVDENDQTQVNQEMLQRIEIHQSDRPSHWQTIESPIHLSKTLRSLDSQNHCILIDCLTLWSLNLLEADSMQSEKRNLMACLATLSAEVIMVSNEVGMGIVPLGEFTRQYVDELGRLHQEIAAASQNMIFMVAGQPITVKN